MTHAPARTIERAYCIWPKAQNTIVHFFLFLTNQVTNKSWSRSLSGFKNTTSLVKSVVALLGSAGTALVHCLCSNRYHWIHEGCTGCINDPDEGPFCRQNRTICEGSGNPPSGCDGHYCDQCQVELEKFCPHQPGSTPNPNTCTECVHQHARVRNHHVIN